MCTRADQNSGWTVQQVEIGASFTTSSVSARPINCINCQYCNPPPSKSSVVAQDVGMKIRRSLNARQDLPLFHHIRYLADSSRRGAVGLAACFGEDCCSKIWEVQKRRMQLCMHPKSHPHFETLDTKTC